MEWVERGRKRRTSRQVRMKGERREKKPLQKNLQIKKQRIPSYPAL